MFRCRNLSIGDERVDWIWRRLMTDQLNIHLRRLSIMKKKSLRTRLGDYKFTFKIYRGV